MVVLSWPDLAARLPSAAPSHLIDSALAPDKPVLDGTLTLFRERHGWCPYSERVWLALEAKGIEHTTVLIDNTGHGRRPSWYSGTTPQIRWADGKQSGESLDIVRELDVRFPATPPLFEASGVDAAISAFRRCFPRNARPSSRAAYLFSYDGPLPRSTFEAALDATDDALGETGGPFFCGDAFTAADVAWAPFLERYAAQLPCLHDGLAPRSARWPRLEAWYSAMDGVPAYAARVQGHPDSWRKVLAMQGYGNAGDPQALIDGAGGLAWAPPDAAVWAEYAASRPHAAATPAAEAAATIVRNRVAIAADAEKRGLASEVVDGGLRGVAAALLDGADAVSGAPAAAELAAHLVERMCVPRDMGLLPALELRRVAAELADS